MNPLCLLTKGRTFKDMADRSGAYKLLANSTLPKYAAVKRPPGGPLHTGPQIAQKSLFEQPTAAIKPAAVEVPKSEASPVVPAKPPQPVVSKSPFAEGAKTAGNGWARGTWNRATGFCKGLMQRFVLGRKQRQVHESTVQAELALEKVTVLRNDLNEDDLEVVLVERKVGTGEKPLARLSKMEMTAEAWIRLVAPFLRKGKESAISPKAGTNPSPELIARV